MDDDEKNPILGDDELDYEGGLVDDFGDESRLTTTESNNTYSPQQTGNPQRQSNLPKIPSGNTNKDLSGANQKPKLPTPEESNTGKPDLKNPKDNLEDKAIKKGVQTTLAELGPILSELIGRAVVKVKQWAKKDGNKWIIAGVLAVPVLFVGFIAAFIFYVAANPFKAIQAVLTGPKIKEFQTQAADAVPNAKETYARYGYVDYKPGTAIAATTKPQPKPGSLAEKMLKVNYKIAASQNPDNQDCPVRFTYKTITNGIKTTEVVDKAYDKQGKEVSEDSYLYKYCLVNSMPLFNMMVRTPLARKVNSYSGTILNYADKKDSANIKGKTTKDLDNYVYDKTYNRITSKDDANPKVNGYATLNDGPPKTIDQYMQEVRNALANQQNPDNIKFPLSDAKAKQPETIAKTLCVFTDGYLADTNIKKAIASRLDTAQRSGIKWNTLSSTREDGQVTNEETTATLKQLDGWTKSTAYSQNVYGTLAGEDINPENLGNTAYGAKFPQVVALLYKLRASCDGVNSNNLSNFLNIVSFGLFGSSRGDANKTVNLIYNALREIIVAESNGKFTKIDDFGLEQLIIGVVRMGGGGAVSGLEVGQQNFNNQSQGWMTNYNQTIMAMGGQALTKEESLKLSMQTENNKITLEKKNGLWYRLAGKNNIRSIANIIQYETPRTPNEIKNKTKEYLASLANPIKLIADTQNTIGYIATGTRNTAFAAGQTGNAYMKLDTVGVSENDFQSADQYAISDEIQTMKESGTEQQKKVLGYFDKCSQTNIPTMNYFMRGYRTQPQGDKVIVLDSDSSSPSIITTEYEGQNRKVNVPIYVAAGEYEQNKNGNFKELGFENRIEMMACELYLSPKSPDTLRDLNDNVQNAVFGFNITELARKYHIYLYSNKMADLMVQLSSTEPDNSIYANTDSTTNTSGAATAPAPTASGECPSGTTRSATDGIFRDKTGKVVSTFVLCKINGTGIVVNISIAGQIRQLIDAANADGVKFNGGAYRTQESQINLRRAHCGSSEYAIYEAPARSCRPPTAIPGTSNHEKGLAIDFTNGSGTIRKGSAQFSWLVNNAAKYGLKNLPSESWHWSVDGK